LAWKLVKVVDIGKPQETQLLCNVWLKSFGRSGHIITRK
jgi:hypothetical protein